MTDLQYDKLKLFIEERFPNSEINKLFLILLSLLLKIKFYYHMKCGQWIKL